MRSPENHYKELPDPEESDLEFSKESLKISLFCTAANQLLLFVLIVLFTNHDVSNLL